MKIESIKIRNYKSFRETDVIRFTDGFNVIVGQNNVGKTSLIEALSVRFKGNPHKSTALRPGMLNPESSVELSFTLGQETFKELLFQSLPNFYLPLGGMASNASFARDKFDELLGSASLAFEYLCKAVMSNDSPVSGDVLRSSIRDLCEVPESIALDSQYAFAVFNRSPDMTTFGYAGVVNAPYRTSADHALFHAIVSRIYTFKAERLNVGVSMSGTNGVLAANASNLPEALHNLLARNPPRFKRLEGYIRRIFPSINAVSVRPVDANNLEITTWTCDPDTEREDLTVPLSDSGTGVGQVLAMLYVAITSTEPRVIIIDEPNSFLHPAASRKLIEILRRDFSRHQLIVTTHSPEVIRAANAKSLKLIKWENSESTIEQFERAKLHEISECLEEVGVKLSDVFGADNILWVEGPTEEAAFNFLLAEGALGSSSSVNIVPVKNTGDFERKNKHLELILEIYGKLSKGNALIPPAIGFVFDREGLSAGNIADIERRSSGLVLFLPRRMLENYLLDADAIAEILGMLPTFQEKGISSADVEKWISQNGSKGDLACGSNVGTKEWVDKVDAALLMRKMFEDLSGAAEKYEKVKHGKAITEWLYANKPDRLNDLVGFLKTIIERAQ